MKLDKVKSITIGFENCEVYEIPLEYIRNFICEGITETISMASTADGKDALVRRRAERCYFAIKKLFSDEKFEAHMGYKHITHYYVNYTDGSEYYFSVPWNVDNEYTNSLEVHETVSYSNRKTGEEYDYLVIKHNVEF
jgi:hypothetical protein